MITVAVQTLRWKVVSASKLLLLASGMRRDVFKATVSQNQDVIRRQQEDKILINIIAYAHRIRVVLNK